MKTPANTQANVVTQSKVKSTWISKLYQMQLFVFTLFYVNVASATATGGLSGGMTTVTSRVDAFTTTALALVGAAAGIYLLYVAVGCWNGKRDWSEMVPALIKVAVAGGAVTAAAWAFPLLSGA